MSMQAAVVRPDGASYSGALTTTTVTIDSTMVRCTGHYSAATVGGIVTARHDGMAVVSGIGTGNVTFTLVTSTPSVNPAGYRTSSLYVDGQHATTFVTTVDNTSQAFTYNVGSGYHYFEVWEAVNYNPTAITFTSVYQISGAVAIQASRTAPANRVALWGDSILDGVTLTTPMLQGAAAKVRQMYDGWVAMDAVPGRKSGDDTAASFGTNVAAMVAGGTTKKCVLLIGYNDYANNVSAATFQTNLAAQLDNAHAADAAISFIVLGPIIATTETANGAGNTLDDYRTACSTICGTRAWTTYVSAKTWIASPGDLSDGVHPNAAGAAKIAGNILYLL